MKTKIVVTGAGGCLGTTLADFADRKNSKSVEWIFLSHSQLDITQRSQVLDSLQHFKPAYLINAAAFTNVDLAQSVPQQAYALNAMAPQYLADACRATRTVLVHISTDYVFDGKDPAQPNGLRRTPYQPSDVVHPLSVYGQSKEAGEQAVCSYEKGVVVRTSWLYSQSPASRNFLSAIPRLLATKDTPLTVEAQQRNAPTYAPHLAEALYALLQSEVEHGVYHGCGTGGCSRLEFALKVREMMCAGKCPAWKNDREPAAVLPISDNALPNAAAPRPLYSVMSNRLLTELINRPIPTWEEAIETFLWNIQF